MPIDFVANLVADPEAYLATHAPFMAGAVGTNPEDSVEFRIERNNWQVRYRRGSKLLGVGNKKGDGSGYEIRKHVHGDGGGNGDTSELFHAVWSGYRGGQSTHCTLPGVGGPDVMLTPRVDGCTLTFMDNGVGDARFGHYNLRDGNRTMGSQGMQDHAEQEHLGRHGELSVFSKESYYQKAKRNNPNSGDRRTVVNAFGVRRGGRWNVFVQYIESKGNGFQIRGVEPIRSGAQYVARFP